MPNTLLHCCCAPCSVRCIEDLRGKGIEPTAYWYNPTIHPYQEYKARRDTLVSYAPTISMALVVDEDYGLRPFVQAVAADIDHRCRYCYACRLDRTARYAAENGFDSFSTTLLISPYQDHELIRTLGETAAHKYGVPFLYRDFRPGFWDGHEKAKALGFYMQKYCGCIFSEEDRYAKAIARDKKNTMVRFPEP